MERCRLVIFLMCLSSCVSLKQPSPFLVQFRDRFASFRIAEFLSVADALVGKDSSDIQFHVPNLYGTRDAPLERINPEVYSYGSRPPVLLWLSGLSASEAVRVCDRCVLVRGLYDVWGFGMDHEESATQALQHCRPGVEGTSLAGPIENPLQPLLDAPHESWCVRIRRHGVGKSGLSPAEASRAERDAILGTYADTLRLVAANGNPVDLKPGGADHRIFVVEDREAPEIGGRRGGGDLRQVYFGRELRSARGPYRGGVIGTTAQVSPRSPSAVETHSIDSGTSDEPLSEGGRSSGGRQKGGRTKDGRNHGNKSKGKDGAFYQRVVSQFSIKQRKYIGPTTMDAEMSFLMANVAGIREGVRVLDPFCGTGGILLACGACGADPHTSFGVDIDSAVLNGRLSARPDEATAFRGERRRLRGLEKQAARAAALSSLPPGDSSGVFDSFDEAQQAKVEVELEHQRQELKEAGLLPDLSIEGNFRDRGLQPPHLVCADAASLPEVLQDYLGKSSQQQEEGASATLPEFDAIVTDPPYGKREWLGADSLLWDAEQHDGQPEQTFFKHQQRQSLVTLRERIDGLLSLASRCLSLNGRLVFFLPVRADFLESEPDDTVEGEEILELLPSHPDLKVISVARECLNHRMHRLLVVMGRRQGVEEEALAVAECQEAQEGSSS